MSAMDVARVPALEHQLPALAARVHHSPASHLGDSPPPDTLGKHRVNSDSHPGLIGRLGMSYGRARESETNARHNVHVDSSMFSLVQSNASVPCLNVFASIVPNPCENVYAFDPCKNRHVSDPCVDMYATDRCRNRYALNSPSCHHSQHIQTLNT